MRSASKLALRILGGKLRGQNIHFAQTKATRPTKAILRESLFGTLASDVVDCVFVEMFAGSGSVGFEALSRGAQKAVFVEQDEENAAQLRANGARLGLGACAQVCCGDCFAILAPLLERLRGCAPIVLYCDPPFALREGQSGIYTRCAEFLGSLCLENVQHIIFETMSNASLPPSIAHFVQHKKRAFGKSALQYYAKETSC